MPRAKRIYTPGDVLHITHRCHKKDFLLKFRRDRDRYLQEQAQGNSGCVRKWVTLLLRRA